MMYYLNTRNLAAAGTMFFAYPLQQAALSLSGHEGLASDISSGMIPATAYLLMRSFLPPSINAKAMAGVSAFVGTGLWSIVTDPENIKPTNLVAYAAGIGAGIILDNALVKRPKIAHLDSGRLIEVDNLLNTTYLTLDIDNEEIGKRVLVYNPEEIDFNRFLGKHIEVVTRRKGLFGNKRVQEISTSGWRHKVVVSPFFEDELISPTDIKIEGTVPIEPSLQYRRSS